MRNSIIQRCLMVVVLMLPNLQAMCGTAAAEEARPHFYNRVAALCVGINGYRSSTIPKLATAESDAKAMGELLRDRYGFDVSYLLGSDATKSAILDRIDKLQSDLDVNDSLLLYFACHGDVIELPSYGQAGFLIPFDANFDPSEDRLVPEAWKREALDMTDLVARLRSDKLKAQHVILIADACCTGFMTARGNFAARPDLQVLLQGSSRCVLAATTDQGKAFSDPDSGHGYFTNALLHELNKADASSVTDVFVQVRRTVAKSSKRQMIPQMAPIGNGQGEFVFLPLSISESEVKRSTRFPLQNEREHLLKGIEQRALNRVAQQSTLADVVSAFTALDYHFSIDPENGHREWQRRFERFKSNASLGEVHALAGLFYCYSMGLGTEKDVAKALHFARLAAETQHSLGLHVLGTCYEQGIGLPKNDSISKKLIEKSAFQGLHLSNYSLASKLGAVPKDSVPPLPAAAQREALARLQQAADDGLPAAQQLLGEIYVDGRLGVVPDLAKAMSYGALAAKSGDERGHRVVAKVYMVGCKKYPKDLSKAAEFLTKAAQAGDAYSQDYLAGEYFSKKEGALGLPNNWKESRKWAELAANQGNARSCLILARLYEEGYGVPINYDKARSYCEQAVNLNYPGAVYRKAVWYRDGMLYDRDQARALRLFEQAAKMGDANSAYLLGIEHWMDLGTPIEPTNEAWDRRWETRSKAIKWFIHAAKYGDDRGVKFLQSSELLLGDIRRAKANGFYDDFRKFVRPDLPKKPDPSL